MEQLKQITVTGPQTWAETHHWVYGAGSVYKKSLIVDLQNKGWYQITTGRKASKLICGEDTEFCFMIYLSGYKIIADDRLTFKHFIPLKRQNIKYIINLQYWLSYTNVLLNSYYAVLNQEKNTIDQILKGWLTAVTKTVIKQQLLLWLQTVKSGKKPPVGQLSAFKASLGTFHSLLYNTKHITAHHLQLKHVLQLYKDKPLLSHD